MREESKKKHAKCIRSCTGREEDHETLKKMRVTSHEIKRLISGVVESPKTTLVMSKEKTGDRLLSKDHHEIREQLVTQEKHLPNQQWMEKALEFLNDSLENELPYHMEEVHRLMKRGLKLSTIDRFKLSFTAKKSKHSMSSWGLKNDDHSSCKDLIHIPAGIVIPYFYRSSLIRLRIRTLC